MAYTCLIVLGPEISFTLPEIKGISGTDGAIYKVIKGNKIINSPSATAVIMQIFVWLSCD